MSLASQPLLLITGIHLRDGREDLLGIAEVRWEGNTGMEECSVGDLISWIRQDRGRAYVQWPTGVRGPCLEVADAPTRRYVRSAPAADGHDSLLALPRF